MLDHVLFVFSLIAETSSSPVGNVSPWAGFVAAITAVAWGVYERLRGGKAITAKEEAEQKVSDAESRQEAAEKRQQEADRYREDAERRREDAERQQRYWDVILKENQKLIERLSGEIEGFRPELQKLYSENTDCQKRAAASESRIEGQEQEIRRLNSELASVRNELATARVEIDQMKHQLSARDGVSPGG